MKILFWTFSIYTNNQLKSRRLIFVIFTIRDYTSVCNTTCKLNLDIEVWWTLCRSGLTSLNMFDATPWDFHRGEALGWRSLGVHSRHGHREDMTVLLVSYTEYGKIHSLVYGCQNFVSKTILREFRDNYPRPRLKS